MLWLFTEIKPVEQAVSQLVFTQHFLLEKIKTGACVGCEQREQTVRFKEVDRHRYMLLSEEDLKVLNSAANL